MSVEDRLSELGLALPAAPAPAGNYVPCVLSGRHLFTSGQIPLRDGAVACRGRVGAEVSLEEAQEASRLCCLGALAVAKQALGSLDRIVRVVKVNGFVASSPDFTDQPKVINGASDLLVAVLGERGRHARAAIGVAALPLGSAVEVDFVFEV